MFRNCEFFANDKALAGTESTDVFDSFFHDNGIAVQMSGGRLERTLIVDNDVGINVVGGFGEIVYCSIARNRIGVIQGFDRGLTIHDNNICDNGDYDLKLEESIHIDAKNNYWCSTDATTIAGAIFDIVDDVSLGQANVEPFRIELVPEAPPF